MFDPASYVSQCGKTLARVPPIFDLYDLLYSKILILL